MSFPIFLSQGKFLKRCFLEKLFFFACFFCKGFVLFWDVFFGFFFPQGVFLQGFLLVRERRSLFCFFKGIFLFKMVKFFSQM